MQVVKVLLVIRVLVLDLLVVKDSPEVLDQSVTLVLVLDLLDLKV